MTTIKKWRTDPQTIGSAKRDISIGRFSLVCFMTCGLGSNTKLETTPDEERPSKKRKLESQRKRGHRQFGTPPGTRQTKNGLKE